MMIVMYEIAMRNIVINNRLRACIALSCIMLLVYRWLQHVDGCEDSMTQWTTGAQTRACFVLCCA